MEEKKIKIGIDIDDVLVECAKHFLDIHYDKTGEKISFENLFTYDLWVPLNISKEECHRIFREDFPSYGFLDNPCFIDKSKQSIEMLFKQFKVFFITSRPLHIKGKTHDFLNKTFSNNDFDIHFSGDFYKTQEKSKAEICNFLGISLIIEDQAPIAVDCAGKGIKVLLMDKPWNKDCEHENIIRVKNWNEVLQKLK